MPSRFVCSKCGRDCRTSIAYESHSKKCTGIPTAATAKPTATAAASTTTASTATTTVAKPVAIEQVSSSYAS